MDLKQSFHVSFVYAFNDITDRQSLWEQMAVVSTPTPWCLMGDINVRSTDEMEGGDVSWDYGTTAFNSC